MLRPDEEDDLESAVGGILVSLSEVEERIRSLGALRELAARKREDSYGSRCFRYHQHVVHVLEALMELRIRDEWHANFHRNQGFDPSLEAPDREDAPTLFGVKPERTGEGFVYKFESPKTEKPQ